MEKNKRLKKLVAMVMLGIVLGIYSYFNEYFENTAEDIYTDNLAYYDLSNIPEYNGNIYVEINNNVPNFTSEDMNIKQDYYTSLKNGKVGMAMIKTSFKKAGLDDKKDSYSHITPSGFEQKKYNTNIVPGGYLYHRCHVIAWKLGGKDTDERNLITGTQSFNVMGMKKFEDMVYDYLKENKSNHVLYRVTPFFEENNELASGVNIEAYSIEDNGKLKFNVYVYNVQEGIDIDYTTGKSNLKK